MAERYDIHPAGTFENIYYVGVFARRDGEWLMCYHASRGSWEFPGGHVEPGEDPYDAATRELLEETGARASRLTALWDDEHILKDGGIGDHGRVYYATIGEILPLSGGEMTRAEFFAELPEQLSYDREWMARDRDRVDRIARSLRLDSHGQQ